MKQDLVIIPYASNTEEPQLEPVHSDVSHSRCLEKSSVSKGLRNPSSLVLFIVNGIGDGFLSLPTIRALSYLYPHKLIVIYDIYPMPTWLFDLPLKKIILVEAIRSNENLLFDYHSIGNSVDFCDVFISLNYGQLEQIQLLSNLLNPRIRIGFDDRFDVRLIQSKERHASDIYFDVILNMNKPIPIYSYCYSPYVLYSSKVIGKKLITSARGRKNDSFCLAIHTDTQPHKMWKLDKWNEFLDLFFCEYPTAVVIVLGTGNEGLMEDRRIYSFTRFSFDISIAILSECDFFIGVDSCLLHVADLYNLVSIGLFISTSDEVYGLKFSKKFRNITCDAFGHISPQFVLQNLKNLRNASLAKCNDILETNDSMKEEIHGS